MSKTLTNRAGTLRLELRDDRLSAWLTIRSSGRLTDEQDILDLIEEAGIKTGFEEAARYMRKHGLEKDFDVAFPVAMCNRVKGESKLNYFFDLDQAKNFSGRVRPEELASLTCIEAGTVIADYNSNIFDRQGSIYDIYGEMLQDEEFDLEAAGLVAGDNVTFSLDRRRFVTERKGFVSVDESGRIGVVEKLVVEGDIQDAADELRSPADLEIRGSLGNSSLFCAGNVELRGDLSNATLSCRGDLSLSGEIRNCRQPGVEVGGNLSCKGIQASRVLCRGRIRWEDSVEGCEIVADGGLETENGFLRGGQAECGGNLMLHELGDPAGSETRVEITIGPYHKALLMQMTRELIRLKDAPGDNQSQIDALNEQIKACEAELDGQLNTFLNRPGDQRLGLRVLGEVHPPVRARILKHEYYLQRRQNGLEIWEKD